MTAWISGNSGAALTPIDLLYVWPSTACRREWGSGGQRVNVWLSVIELPCGFVLLTTVPTIGSLMTSSQWNEKTVTQDAAVRLHYRGHEWDGFFQVIMTMELRLIGSRESRLRWNNNGTAQWWMRYELIKPRPSPGAVNDTRLSRMARNTPTT